MSRIGFLLLCILVQVSTTGAWARSSGLLGTQTFTVNSLADPGNGTCDVAECTLREALSAAATAGGGTIEFQEGLSGTILLTAQLLINTNGIVINGPGPEVIAVSGNDITRVFRIFESDVVIRGLTVRDGNSSTDPQSTLGAGIFISNSGNPTLENLRVLNNFTTSQAGGIYVFFSGGTIRNSEVSGNTATQLSGIGINGSAGHTVLVENTTISGNIGSQSESGIGVLTNSGQIVTLRHITVAGNSGAMYGARFGGLGQTVVEASVFADNLTPGDLWATGSNDQYHDTLVGILAGTLNGSNSFHGVDAGLAGLAFFEGSTTRVHPLGAGAARNHVLGSGCGTAVTEDQLGRPRPQGLRCDAGAFEAESVERLAYWTFDEFIVGEPLVDLERVSDISGIARDARIAGGLELPTATPGRTGGTALQFDTSADRVVFEPGFAFGDGGPAAGPAIEFAQDDSFTIEALVRLPDGLSQLGCFIAKDAGVDQPSWWFCVDGDHVWALVGDGPNQPSITGATPINDGRWHHVAMVRDADNDELRVYVDYVLDGSVVDSTVGDSVNASDIVLGAFNDGSRQLTGEMDFVRITRAPLEPEGFVQVLFGPNLVVAIEDGTETVSQGALLDYTVSIVNLGDEDAIDAVVEDVVPVEMVATNWTCTASGGATCTASGSGSLADTVTIPLDGSLTFTVTASITPDPFESVTYSVTANVAPPQQEIDPASSTAVDINFNTSVFADGFETSSKVSNRVGKSVFDAGGELDAVANLRAVLIARGTGSDLEVDLSW